LNVESAGQSWERFQAGAGSIAIVQAGRYWAEVAGTAGAGVVAAAPIPTRDGQPLSIARGLAITMVARDAARQEQAILLLEWLLASDHSAQWTQAAGYLPATPSSLRLWELPDEDKATLQTLMEAAVPPPRPEAMTVVGQAMHEALEAVLTGQSTPEEAAAAAMNSLDE
jgi:ABC-type glycerol-3-phosphate transport system substrate-binding protein